MAMRIVNNMPAIQTLNTLNANSDHLAKSLQKVSSGMKINSAADDASGYAISERMRVQIRSLDQANRNTQNGISMLKVAEGAVSSTVDILKTLKDKVINAANDTNTDADRQTIQKELDQSVDQINDNANVTFNGKILMDGSHNSQVKHDRNIRITNGTPQMNVARNYGRGTFTHLTNMSLSSNTGFITTKLTDLENRNGENLGIREDDTVTISFVQEGKTYTASSQVGTLYVGNLFYNLPSTATYGNELVDPEPIWDGLWCLNMGTTSLIGHDAGGNDVYTPDGEPALTIMAGGQGLTSQIAGLAINVTDKDGNIKKSANAALNDWQEMIRAEEECPDNSLVLQVGAKANQSIKVGFTDMRARALGLQGAEGNVLNISTQLYANAAISVMDYAIKRALDEQTKIGSIQSRLAYTSANLTTASENVTASESTIRDADMAKEMPEYTKHNLLLQASQTILSQANQSSSNVLALLQ